MHYTIYAYGSNDPISRFDPLGFEDFTSEWFPIRQQPWNTAAWAYLRARAVVSVQSSAGGYGIQISFHVNRPADAENKRRWFLYPEYRENPVFDGWKYPNLAALFNARGVTVWNGNVPSGATPRYGGPDPYHGGIDDDFGAVVVQREGASIFDSPLVSGDWVNDNGSKSMWRVSHDIHIAQKFFLWMGNTCIRPPAIGLWFAYCDMGDGGVSHGWPKEWHGTDLLYLRIAFREEPGVGLVPTPQFEHNDSAPPGSPMQSSWAEWFSGGAVPRYIDISSPL